MSALQNVPRITCFLWFDSNAEEAVDFYLSIFKNSRRLDELSNPDGGPSKSRVLTVAFELDGQTFTAMNGGPGTHLPTQCHSSWDVSRSRRLMNIGRS